MTKIIAQAGTIIDVIFNYEKMSTKVLELTSIIAMTAFFNVSWLPIFGGFIVAISLATLQFAKAYKIFKEANSEDFKNKKSRSKEQ